MAKFKYIGDPNDNFGGPDVVHQYGVTFKKGEVVDVPEKTDDDKANISKLEGHSHFVDMSDRDRANEVASQQKAAEKLEADKAKAAEEQRKRDEADRKQREQNAAKAATKVDAGTAPRPPGTVTREPMNDPFQGRTVEERTRAEDHTSAGKLKG